MASESMPRLTLSEFAVGKSQAVNGIAGLPKNELLPLRCSLRHD